MAKESQTKLQNTLQTIRELVGHKKLTHAEMNVGFSAPNLNSTSWTTAAATGALAYMSYDEVKKFGRTYDLQALLQRREDDQIKNVSSAAALAAFGPGGPPTASDEQLRNLERSVMECMAGLLVADQLSQQLAAEYSQVLKGR